MLRPPTGRPVPVPGPVPVLDPVPILDPVPARGGPLGDLRTRLIVVLSLAASGLVGLGLLLPWGPQMLDLVVYRLGASAVLTGQDVYAVREPATGLAFTYPVFAAVLFIPYALMPLGLARGVALVISMVALWVLVHVTVRHAIRTWGFGRAGDDPRLAWRWSPPLTVAAVICHPVLETLLFGQVNLVIAALVTVDLLVVGRRQRGWLVGLATGVKLVAGLFAVYYLLTGQLRAAGRAALGLLATVVLGFVVQPGPAWAFWTDHMLDPDRVGGIAYVTNQSILGLSSRLLRDPHPPAALTLSLSATAALVALAVAWRAHRRGDEMTAMCVVAAGSLLASPISWSHHWVWVIPAGGPLLVWARRRGAWWRWATAAAVLLTLWVGPMRFMPKAGLNELHHTVGQQIVANLFGFLAIGFLACQALPVGREAWQAVRRIRGRAPIPDRSPAR